MESSPLSTSGTPESEAEVPWTDYVDTVVRWRRFVLTGVGVSFGLVLLVGLLSPRLQECEATLSMPNLEASEDESKRLEPPRPGGLPLASYKRLEKSLSDVTLLQGALRGKLSEGEIRGIAPNVRAHLSPLTSGVRDDILRLEKSDTIVAIRLSYSAPSVEKAEEIVARFGELVRDLVVAGIARERIEIELLRSTAAASRLNAKKLDLTFSNRSLQTLEGDLQRLSSAFPQAAAPPREVVDVNNGGYRYLPPSLQLVGVRARRADNDYEIRMLERALEIETGKATFLRRIDDRLKEVFQKNAGAPDADLPTLFERELLAFLKERAGAEGDLRAALGPLGEMLRAYQRSIRFIQQPTTRTRSRALALAAAAIAAALFFPVAALVGESWRRYHGRA